jgi:hypothetical protein
MMEGNMKGLMIKSTAAVVGFPLVALLACASENLQTTGLDPASSVNPSMPGGPAMPSSPATDPDQPSTPSTDPNTPAAGDDTPSSEGNPDGIAPPAVDPDDDMAAGEATDDPMDMPGSGTPPPEVPEVVLTPSQIGGELEGFLHLAPCESQDFGHDCTLPGCQGGTKNFERPLQLGGEPGTVYDVTIHVYGVVEPRSYQGGLRRAGPNFDVNGSDLWHEGGTIPANPGTYNSYEFHVEPPVQGAPNVYYLNSRTGGDQQIVVRIDYTATFPVQGGGTIRFRSFDSNCRQITNCATNECGPLNPKPLTVAAVQNASPAPAAFVQPYQTGANIGRGQWVYVDVTDAAPRP